jgi:Domain of unknown function (DUF1735)
MYKICILLLTGFVLGLIACSKEKNDSFTLTLAESGLQTAALPVKPGAQEIQVKALLPDISYSPIEVTLRKNEAALTAYNAANATQFAVLPDSCFSLPGTQTLNGGSKGIILPVSLFTDKIPPVTAYVLPLTISGGGNEASRTVLYRILLQNEYSGIYDFKGRYRTSTLVPGDFLFSQRGLQVFPFGQNGIAFVHPQPPGFAPLTQPAIVYASIQASQELDITIPPAPPFHFTEGIPPVGANSYVPATRSFYIYLDNAMNSVGLLYDTLCFVRR